MTGTSTRLAEMKPGRPRTAARETTAAWLAAGVSGILGFAIDGYRAGKVPLWGDEGVTKAMASRGVGQILATMPHDDVVHGAYYLVMHAVIGVAGSGFTALRFPSVIAMAVAAAVTALLARRLAALAGSPAPAVTGLAAGVLFAFLPGVLRYAQEARSYAIVTMLATISTYLLVKALTEGGGARRWTLYGVATGLTGLFNLFGLFLLAAHAVTVTAARIARRDTGKDRPRRTIAGLPAGWIIASAGAVVVLIPVALLARSEQSALAWLGKPPFAASLRQLALFWAGPARITLFLFGLAAFGAIAGTAASARQRGPVTPVAVTLPWLVLPPVLLLGISQIDPLYSGRYLEYCTPALAIAASWGLTWLARAIGAPLHRFRLGTIRLSWAGWLPAAAIGVLAVILLIPADHQERLPRARGDNLLLDSQIVGAAKRPGDVVLFVPISYRPVEDEFPSYWAGVRDIALAQAPVPSNTLYGTDVSPAELLKRFAHVTRVWVYTSPQESTYLTSARATPVDRLEGLLTSRMKLVRSWTGGDKTVSLYETRASAGH